MYQRKTGKHLLLYGAIMTWMGLFHGVAAENAVYVEADRLKAAEQYETQHTTIITQKDIEAKQAKNVEDVVFHETGVSRTVDAMGRVGVSIRGADPRHTLILIDGQPAIGEFAKYAGQGDELMRLGAENLDHIEVVQGAASAKYGSGAIGGVINVVTKKPTKKSGLQFNVESLRTKGDKGSMPYSNFFMRADTGKIGNINMAIYGSKRDVMPVYAVNPRKRAELAHDDMTVFAKNSLRYFGEQSNIGMSAHWQANKNHGVDIRVDQHKEELHRFNKGSNSLMAPEVQFKRSIKRNQYSIGWHTKNQEKINWDIEVNYAKLKENDMTLTNTVGHVPFFGANELNQVDTIDHSQFDVHSDFHIAVNDKHFVNTGFGIKKEKGSGSRLKSAPKTTKQFINPWDYDKHLKEDPITHEVASRVEDYPIEKDADGMPYWNRLKEWYGYEKGVQGKDYLPSFTYEEFFSQEHAFDLVDNVPKEIEGSHMNSNNRISYFLDHTTTETRARFNELVDKLYEQNPEIKAANASESRIRQSTIVYYYYTGKPMEINGKSYNVKLNNVQFKKGDALHNRVTVGEADIQKEYVYVQDDWQVNKNTTITPIVRLDHSSLFGSNLTFHVGMLHNLRGDVHNRLKANIGTSYNEPGMGELYYNWEMYSGNPLSGGLGGGTARMGWYWVGNPDLKPEKSINVDVGWEHENKTTSYRASAFHNRIRDYHSIYFTGHLLDFYPEYNERTHLGSEKYQHSPDMIYSFKNIGKVSITGLEAEVKHNFNKKWSGKLGYTFLHTENQSDPTLPKQLLDKPQHKIDVGINYDDKDSGLHASLYGNLYMNMLDSRSLAGNGNFIDSYGPAENENPNISHIDTYFKEGKKQEYQSKTYSVWNFIVQKSWGNDMKAYIGVDNLFNYRDDDRAMQGRVYRVGINFKIGSDGHVHKVLQDQSGKEVANIDLGPVDFAKFITTPFGEISSSDLRFAGDYKWRTHYMEGQNRPDVRTTLTSAIGSAMKNMQDPSENGWEQKVQVGVEGRINDKTAVKVITSASGHAGHATEDTVDTNRSLRKVKLEEANITRKEKSWDFSVGRLPEKLGETGYWFNQTFDGVRAVWTKDNTQVRVGYGDFSRNTGITDSAYTQMSYKTMERPLTVNEFLNSVEGLKLTKPFKPMNIAVREKVGDVAGQYETIRKYYNWAKQAYPNYLKSEETKYYISIPKAVYGYTKTYDPATGKAPEKVGEAGVKYLTETGTYPFYSTDTDKYATASQTFPRTMSADLYPSLNKDILGYSYDNDAPIQGDGSEFVKKFLAEHGATLIERYNKNIKEAIKSAEDSAKEEYGYAVDDLKSHTASRDEKQRDLDTVNKKLADFVAAHPTGLGTLESYRGKESANGTFTDAEKEHFELLKKQDLSSWLVDYYNDKIKDDTENINRPPFTATDIVGGTVDENVLRATLEKENTLPADGVDNKGLVAPVAAYANKITSDLRFTEKGSLFPRVPLGEATGVHVLQQGYVLDRAEVPSIKRAFFVEVKQQVKPNLGVSAWYLHSQGNRDVVFETAKETAGVKGNESHRYNQVANVVALGARYNLGNRALLSFDYGKNLSNLGKHLNGHTAYDYNTATNTFAVLGHKMGSTPTFWVMRAQVGMADIARPQTWSMYADYKHFEHGSFFGGNGTNGLTDRYLDGIESFTLGGSYVPAKNWLVEASYTFGAKGIGQRDTLFGPERFNLGNYSTVQMTYKF